jgi:hypothetical protein
MRRIGIINDHKIHQITSKYTKWPQSIPNNLKVYQMTSKYTKWPQSIPNDHKVYQMVIKENKIVYSRPSKIGQNWGFGTKIYYHLAVLCKNRGESFFVVKILSLRCILTKIFVGASQGFWQYPLPRTLT